MRTLACLALLSLLACSRDLAVPGAHVDTTPPARIDDLTVTVVPGDGGFFLFFVWTVPYDPDDPAISQYEIRVGPDINDANFSSGVLLPLVGLRTEGGKVFAGAVPPPSLPAHVTVGIRAFDAAGNPSPVGRAGGNPLSLFPPGRIDDLAIAAELPGAVALSWHDPGAFLDGGIASGYDLEASFAAVPDGGAVQPGTGLAIPFGVAPKAAGTPRTALVTGLFPHTDFWLSLSAVGPAGTGAPSPAVHARLPLSTLPPAPLSPSAASVALTSPDFPDAGPLEAGNEVLVSWPPVLNGASLDTSVASYLVVRLPASSPAAFPGHGIVYAPGSTLGDGVVAGTAQQGPAPRLYDHVAPGAYRYEVVSLSTSGDYSAPQLTLPVAVRDALPPLAPDELVAMPIAGAPLQVRVAIDEHDLVEPDNVVANPDRSYSIYASGDATFADGGTLVAAVPECSGGALGLGCSADFTASAPGLLYVRAVAVDRAGNRSPEVRTQVVPGSAPPGLDVAGPSAEWVDQDAGLAQVATVSGAGAVVQSWATGQAAWASQAYDFSDAGLAPFDAVGLGAALDGNRMLWLSGDAGTLAVELGRDGGVVRREVGPGAAKAWFIDVAPGLDSHDRPGDHALIQTGSQLVPAHAGLAAGTVQLDPPQSAYAGDSAFTLASSGQPARAIVLTANGGSPDLRYLGATSGSGPGLGPALMIDLELPDRVLLEGAQLSAIFADLTGSLPSPLAVPLTSDLPSSEFALPPLGPGVAAFCSNGALAFSTAMSSVQVARPCGGSRVLLRRGAPGVLHLGARGAAGFSALSLCRWPRVGWQQCPAR